MVVETASEMFVTRGLLLMRKMGKNEPSRLGRALQVLAKAPMSFDEHFAIAAIAAAKQNGPLATKVAKIIAIRRLAEMRDLSEEERLLAIHSVGAFESKESDDDNTGPEL